MRVRNSTHVLGTDYVDLVIYRFCSSTWVKNCTHVFGAKLLVLSVGSFLECEETVTRVFVLRWFMSIL